jgi:hypothetical protein
MSDRNQIDSGRAGWDAWGNHVLTTLEKLEKKVDVLEDKVGLHREQTLVDIATLKAKAGVWGSVAGVIASLITSLIVGLLVYQLTHNTMDKTTPQPRIPVTGESVILPKDDLLGEFRLNVHEGDV